MDSTLWSFGSFAFPMICTFVLVVIAASGNGLTGLILMAIRSWPVTGCGRWSEGMDALAGSTISSPSAPAMPATASTRDSPSCDARVWRDGGDEGEGGVSWVEGKAVSELKYEQAITDHPFC